MSRVRIKTGKRNTTVTRTQIRTAVRTVRSSSSPSQSSVRRTPRR